MDVISIDRKAIEYWGVSCPQDASEYITRADCYGIAGTGYESYLFWRIDSRAHSSEILDFFAKDVDEARALVQEYGMRCKAAGVVSSVSELPLSLDDALRDAFLSLGFCLEEAEATSLRTSLLKLASYPLLQSAHLSDRVESASSLNLRQFQQGLQRGALKSGIPLDPAFQTPTWFDCNLSSCILLDGRVCGFLLVHRTISGAYRAEMFYVAEPATTRNLMDLIQYTMHLAKEQLSADTQVIIPRRRDVTRALTDKLFPDLKGEQILRITASF